MSEQILRQLRWIKWFTVVLALSFAVIAGTFGWLSYEMSLSFERSNDSDSFSDRASTLLQEGKETEVLKLVEEREKMFPKDLHVHWYRGKAYYQLGQFSEALDAIQRAHDLAPTWREEYTEPFLKAINEKLAAKR
ncbi:MAG TPA: tetratricopeptide repeat protein [Nitrospira sp.]|nr:tetratricopeptide repeat protein [Nitrospira sp.]